MTTTSPATIELETRSAREVVDITARVGALLGGAPDGSCHLFLRHTTAGLMILTGEAGVPEDIMDILQSLVPTRAYRHDSAAHVAAHFLSGLVGPSVHVPVQAGRLALGEFQRIVRRRARRSRRRAERIPERVELLRLLSEP
jgi:secondary thiamine-phosphate synthase enzyme